MYTLPPKAQFSSSVGNGLFNSASLDLHFAKTKSLVDATTGSNLVDFTRASSGTYVGSDGLIKTATTNLLLQSEDFSTTWAPIRSSVSSDQIGAPIGTGFADKLVLDSTTTNSHFIQQVPSINAGSNLTLSVYLKAAEWLYARLEIVGNVGTSDTIIYPVNLQTGTQLAAASATGSATVALSSIQNSGNGWFRVIVSGKVNNTDTAVRIRITFVADTGGVLVNGDSTSGFYLWGAQLEQSSTVGEYVKTTSTINSAPRFNHDPTTGESLGLLVEESRTNFILNSSPATTGAAFGAAVADTVSGVLAPDGQLYTVRRVTYPTTGNYRFGDTSSGTAGTTYTGSVWMKTESGTVNINIDVNDSTVKTLTVTQNWQRFDVTGANATNPYRFFDISGGSGQVILFWGAQLEEGAFPTSYIPTTSSTVTRAADVASISGSNFSGWYNQSEGTVFTDVARTYGNILGFSDGTPTERFRLAAGSTAMVAFGSSGGSTQFNINTGSDTWISPSAGKGALALKANDFSVSANGSPVQLDPSGVIPSVDRLFIGTAQIDSKVNGPIKRLTYWNRRLPDSTLVTITT